MPLEEGDKGPPLNTPTIEPMMSTPPTLPNQNEAFRCLFLYFLKTKRDFSLG